MTKETKIISIKRYKALVQAEKERQLLRTKLAQRCPDLKPWLDFRFPKRQRD